MFKFIFPILFALVTCLSSFSVTIDQFPPDMVIVIVKDDGSVIIREPRLEDYVHAQEMKDKQTKEIPIKERIFGKKCKKR